MTAKNLLASERFWPYQTALVRDWQGAAGAPALPAGALGVLIRVEPFGRARIDFGRDGIHAVPLAATDLLQRAEGIRRGEIENIFGSGGVCEGFWGWAFSFQGGGRERRRPAGRSSGGFSRGFGC